MNQHFWLPNTVAKIFILCFPPWIDRSAQFQDTFPGWIDRLARGLHQLGFNEHSEAGKRWQDGWVGGAGWIRKILTKTHRVLGCIYIYKIYIYMYIYIEYNICIYLFTCHKIYNILPVECNILHRVSRQMPEAQNAVRAAGANVAARVRSLDTSRQNLWILFLRKEWRERTCFGSPT